MLLLRSLRRATTALSSVRSFSVTSQAATIPFTSCVNLQSNCSSSFPLYSFLNDSLFMFPCLDDNYGFILKPSSSSPNLLLIDSPDGDRYLNVISHITKHISKHSSSPPALTLLNTHHHWDHTQGNAAILDKYPNTKIYSPDASIHGTTDLLDPTDLPASFSPPSLPALSIVPLDTSGHTTSHLSYSIPALSLFFAGDALFSLGCGRIFEGTAAMSFKGLQNIRDRVGEDAWLCCAHEYTAGNVAFTRSLDGYATEVAFLEREAEVGRLRADGKMTLPVRMGAEFALNPFLRADTVDKFTKVRALKDAF